MTPKQIPQVWSAGRATVQDLACLSLPLTVSFTAAVHHALWFPALISTSCQHGDVQCGQQSSIVVPKWDQGVALGCAAKQRL